MVYQMGTQGVKNFENTLQLIEEKNYEAAKKEALNSKWAQQTPERANSVVENFTESTKQKSNVSLSEKYTETLGNKKRADEVIKLLSDLWNHPTVQADQSGTLRRNPAVSKSERIFDKYNSFEDFVDSMMKMYKQDNSADEAYNEAIEDLRDLKGYDKLLKEFPLELFRVPTKPFRGESYSWDRYAKEDLDLSEAVIEESSVQSKATPTVAPKATTIPKQFKKLSSVTPLQAAFKLMSKSSNNQPSTKENKNPAITDRDVSNAITNIKTGGLSTLFNYGTVAIEKLTQTGSYSTTSTDLGEYKRTKQFIDLTKDFPLKAVNRQELGKTQEFSGEYIGAIMDPLTSPSKTPKSSYGKYLQVNNKGIKVINEEQKNNLKDDSKLLPFDSKTTIYLDMLDYKTDANGNIKINTAPDTKHGLKGNVLLRKDGKSFLAPLALGKEGYVDINSKEADYYSKSKGGLFIITDDSGEIQLFINGSVKDLLTTAFDAQKANPDKRIIIFRGDTGAYGPGLSIKDNKSKWDAKKQKYLYDQNTWGNNVLFFKQ